MTNPNKTFEALRHELRKEAGIEPKGRSREYENLTLQYFLEHGRKTEDHDLWRECHMLEEMLAIMDRRFMALNPHKRRQQELNQVLAGVSERLSHDRFVALHKYEDEVDDEGYSQKEADSDRTSFDPGIRRQDLEIRAAENYLEATWGIRRKQLSKPQSHGEIQQKVKAKNPYPVIGHTELQTELQKSHNSYEAIKQAVKRAIEEGQETGNPPWPMRGCAAEYRIVKSEIKKGRSKPTPASCKYQKIYREEED